MGMLFFTSLSSFFPLYYSLSLPSPSALLVLFIYPDATTTRTLAGFALI